MAIYELVEWQVVPGKMEEILKLEQPWLAYVRSIGGKPIGGFTTAVGETNRLLSLIAYEDFGQFGRSAQAAQQNPAELQRMVQAASGMYTGSKMSLLVPTAGSAELK
jgi:hypothetical protein